MSLKFPVQPNADIRITNVDGDLRMEGHAEAEIRARGDDPQVQVLDDGHRAEIMSSGDCVLTVPNEAQVNIDLIGADAVIKNMRHEVSIESVGSDFSARDVGGLHLGDVGGDLDLKRIQGNIEIGFVGSDANFIEIASDILVDSIGADVRLQDIAGNCSIDTIGADLVLMTNDLRRLGTCIRLSRRCRRTIYANVSIGLGWTVVIVAMAATGRLGASGAIIAALLHNVSTVVVMANAGRLLKFQEALA